MPKGIPQKLPTGIAPKTGTRNGKTVPVVTEDGTPVYRVRVRDAVLGKQVERVVEGLDAAKAVLAEFKDAKRRPGRIQAERIKFVDVAARTSCRTRPSGTAPRGLNRRWRKSGPDSTFTSFRFSAARG